MASIIDTKLINWYFRCFSTNSNVNGYEVDNLPIPLPSMEVQNGIVDLVNQILTIKANDNTANTVSIENQIDKLVYQMYELTDEEIAVIEAAIK